MCRYLQGPPTITAWIAAESSAAQRSSRETEIRRTVEILGKQLNDSSDVKVQRDGMMQELERMILATERPE